MGLRYKKSINLGGGFRINLSKSGIGYSWGVKGYRVTKTAKGTTRKTLTLPGTGLSYVEETSNSKQPKKTITTQESNDNVSIIENSDITNFKNEEYLMFIERLEKILTIDFVSSILIIVSFLLLFVPVLCAICLIIGLVTKLYIRLYGKITLTYEVDDHYSNVTTTRNAAWNQILNCDSIWSLSKTKKTNDQRKNAGAKTLVTRVPSKITNKQPFYLKSNLPFIKFKTTKEEILALPDRILIIKKRKVGVLSYNEISFHFSHSRFIEEKRIPSDTEVLTYTWKYVNKSGSPDKRFKNNKKLPICHYGEIVMTSESGFNTILQCSNAGKAEEFYKLITSISN